MQQTTTPAANSGDDLMQLHESVMFDEAELDLTLEEMGLATELPVETQRALLGRVMLSLSLAASVRGEDVYQKSIDRLGSISGPGAVDAGTLDEECCFFIEVLRVVGGDLIEELDGESLLDLEMFGQRIVGLEEGARVEAGHPPSCGGFSRVAAG